MALKPRALLLGGTLASSLGVVVASTVHQTVGGVIVVLGWAVAIYGMHAFGRAGRASKLASEDDDARVRP